LKEILYACSYEGSYQVVTFVSFRNSRIFCVIRKLNMVAGGGQSFKLCKFGFM